VKDERFKNAKMFQRTGNKITENLSATTFSSTLGIIICNALRIIFEFGANGFGPVDRVNIYVPESSELNIRPKEFSTLYLQRAKADSVTN